jgi:trans-2,3-dihydro-3-hydroxyanthranilate isomerase
VRWVDAFTSTPLAGNPCAVVLDALGLDDPIMQAIARETNLSETSFVFPGDHESDFVVRYWTPSGEIPMAGHPTIATTHALCESGAIHGNEDSVRLKMPAAVIPVAITRGAPPSYAMSQPPPVFMETYGRGAVAEALGLTEHDLLKGMVPQTVSTGTPQLMVALGSVDALDRVKPDRAALFDSVRDWNSVHVFAHGSSSDVLVSRHFADFNGLIEDPFTGSATGGMAAYCARYRIVTLHTYTVAQGMHVQRPGRARIEVHGTPEELGRITVAGSAVTVMTATLRLER